MPKKKEELSKREITDRRDRSTMLGISKLKAHRESIQMLNTVIRKIDDWNHNREKLCIPKSTAPYLFDEMQRCAIVLTEYKRRSGEAGRIKDAARIAAYLKLLDELKANVTFEQTLQSKASVKKNRDIQELRSAAIEQALVYISENPNCRYVAQVSEGIVDKITKDAKKVKTNFPIRNRHQAIMRIEQWLYKKPENEKIQALLGKNRQQKSRGKKK